MKVRKKFPSKVACVHCNGGCRANQSPEGYDLCLYGCTGCGACMEVCRFGAIVIDREAGCLRAKCAWKAKDPSQLGPEPAGYVRGE